MTSGGENIAPLNIEQIIKNELPCISNVVVIGDKRKYLTLLLTFKVQLDNDTPGECLSPEAVAWCKEVGSTCETVTQILSGPDARVMAAIQAGIDRTNKKSTSRASTVQKWTILPVDFSVNTGEIGPTLKTKRFFVNQKYSETIDRLYE